MSTPIPVTPPEADPFDARRVHGATGLLGAFNAAGVLAGADVHVARRLGALTGEDDEAVLLAVALAVRAPRLGHVLVDLTTVAQTTVVESEVPVDLTALAWPEAGPWPAQVAGSALVAGGDRAPGGDTAPGGDAARPLRLDGSRLYLDRYWGEETRVAADLARFAATPAAGVDADVLRAGMARMFTGEEAGGRQALAAATAVLRRLTVVAGGPGTGKTTTVARIAALLLEQGAGGGGRPPLIALAAPTGKAAARLEEAVHEQAGRLDVDAAVRADLLDLRASTLHRLLGWRPGSHSRFRHDRDRRLAHDVVIVDETSMVSLSLMARLAEAVRPDARLILVGDPGQLTSIEAGAVLGDVVGSAAPALRLRPDARAALEAAAGGPVAAGVAGAGDLVADGVVALDRGHRFGGVIADLAAAIRAGDADTAVACLAGGHADVTWVDGDPDQVPAAALAPVRDGAVAAGLRVIEAARRGDGPAALTALGGFRVLCAHRRGPYGAARWMTVVQGWLADAIPGFEAGGQWYVGRPLLVTENDHSLRLYNGDTGVVVAVQPDGIAGGRRGGGESGGVSRDIVATAPGQIAAVFERAGSVVSFSPTRLHAVDTVHAMTVHKSQGSQFGVAAVLLPGPQSPILTRELLYTAVTRARERLIVAGTEATIRQAVARPAARASALGPRLWSSP